MMQIGPALSRQAQYAQVNGLKMYYEESGSGQPLILLHGGTVTSKMWEAHIPIFARHFRVIAPDSRGHGRTNNPAGELSYRSMANDVVALIHALDLDGPLICGYSDGGNIALEIGMRYPDLAAALVIGAAWHRFSESYQNSLKAFGFPGPGTADFEMLQTAPIELVEFWRAEHFRSDDPDYWRKLLTQAATMWWTPLDYAAGDFQKITAPTLVLTGDRDDLIELEQAIELYQLIPQAELAVIPDKTHMAVTTEGNLFAVVVLDFLLRHAREARHGTREDFVQSVVR
jgi:pimeloyl-ACP methyl ester carboxylesterase